ncbi:MAG: cobalt transporter CbiM [Lentisphaerae bacterium]|nr:cobalt transporter CbiM [Lentisphaerota bacterium]
MHVSEGILTGPVLAGGAVLAAAGVAIGLRRMSVEATPRTAMLAAVFFVASLIHVPLGPSNVHLILNGLAGLLLGWSVFPALAVALLLQAMLFQFGGLTVLGVNTLLMALPGLLVYLALGRAVRGARTSAAVFAAGCAAGALSVALAGVLLTLALALGGRGFLGVAGALLAAHVPVMVADGLVTGFCVLLLHKVRPSALDPAGAEAPP